MALLPLLAFRPVITLYCVGCLCKLHPPTQTSRSPARLPPLQYPAGVERPKFAQLIIPTLDSVRYEHLLGLVHSVGKATLLVGGAGGRSGEQEWGATSAPG